MQQIPHELYRPIILNLSPNHLANVAIASRALHYETTLALYCNVNLRDASIDRILSWANAVAHNSRLAEQVKSICLPSEVRGSRYTGNLSEVPEVQESLTKAFGAVFNLVSFLIRPCRDPAIVNNSRYSYLTFDCFKTCHFRLKSFRVFASSTLSEREGLLLFLSQQTEIEDWVACDPKMSNNVITQSMLPSSLLPKLSTFYMNYYNTHGLPLLKFASSRPLVWLSIENNRPDESRSLVEILEAAGGCRQTLLHFEYLSLQSIVYTKLANHISFISRTFPRLESLKYTRNFIGLVLMDVLDMLKALPEAFSRFTRLKIFFVEAPYCKIGVCDVSEVLGVVRQLFQGCETLQRVGLFIYQPVPWKASYCRVDSGEVVLVEDEAVDYDSWRVL